MKTTIYLRDEQIELESCLDTFRIYENAFKRNLLNDIDRIEEMRADTKNTVNVLFEMCNVIWALANAADNKQKLDRWTRYDPAEILSAYMAASLLVIKSFQVSPKNDSAAGEETAQGGK